jgi:phage/plasmid-like protein (TIGR03299 family)
MAHNIDRSKGLDAFFAVGEKAWHGLGQIVQDVPTSDKAIKLAGLDYEVTKVPMFAQRDNKDFNPEYRDITNCNWIRNPNVFSTFREDTGALLGTVGNRYEVLQNIEAFKWFDDIVGEGKAIYQTAGALNGGATIFITAKMPSYIQVRTDNIEKYLVLVNSHDGSETLQMMFTPVRVVCANTLNQAMRGAQNVFKMRHTKSLHDNMKKATEALGIISQVSDEFQNLLIKMTNVIFNDNRFDDLLQMIYPAEEVVRDDNGDILTAKISTRSKNLWNSIRDYRETGIGQDSPLCRGTAYGAYNAITGYFQNSKQFKTQEDKFESVLYGDVSQKTQKVFNALQTFSYKGSFN